ncbi:MAG: M3 family oligoendopeptidase [Bacteroidetes bacterium]|nr:M3 family oligoendopeptidase [Bacteroidota bacterium]
MSAEVNGSLLPTRKKRVFVSEDFTPDTWDKLEYYYQNLLGFKLDSVKELKQWLFNWSELETVISEYSRWIYVRTTVDTSDEKAKAELIYLYTEIVPRVSPLDNQLKQKFISCPFIDELDSAIYATTIRKVKKEVEMFREANISLQSEMNIKQSTFDQITGPQSIQHDGQEITLQQAAVYLKSTDRKLREEIFLLSGKRRMQDADKLDALLTELIQLRHQMAVNAGYKNYIQYRFDELGRFDYTPADCETFHRAVEEVVMPVVNKHFHERKEKLGLDKLKPWDAEVDLSGKAPLQPFKSAEEMTDKTIECFAHLDSYFSNCLEIMKSMKYLDLESRKNKGPGGYNMAMPEIGVPFIFMNSANSEQDVITMVHEGGHAVQTFLTNQLELNAFKELTPEIAEVASMGMELLSMEHWNVFYPNTEDLTRAKKRHLQYLLGILSKTCQGDAFQFWLYNNPEHSIEERRNKWTELNHRFSAKEVDWTGQEEFERTGYHKILHFYIVPLYYIEYAFAQLGAIALWHNFRQNREKTIENYKNALRLGYTKPIPVFYETAGIKFDFSKQYISGLVDFLKIEEASL